ncbi:KAP family P-loop NTPase fold protein [Paracoccus haeundaensis]|uniref:KAP NTPase domain-containing protein n=1 Tax=Paracoccus haeundaensis TaxID=225362 RepID=A0A5C4RAB7_9RHOB|nr:P-loop NTPase fold protein [Paracoccus haeundaensis]TNH40943.1 hypothetical protein FHD67_02640 [Paracoccus haeundaensis]
MTVKGNSCHRATISATLSFEIGNGKMTDTVDEIWADDLLKRKQEAQLLTTILPVFAESYRKWGGRGSFVLNVDANWGLGKTYFVKRLVRHLNANSCPALYIDAWADDHSDDPFTAVMAEIERYLVGVNPKAEDDSSAISKTFNHVKRSYGKHLLTIAKGTVKTIGLRHLSDAVEEIYDDISSGTTKDILVEAKDQVMNVAGDEFERYAQEKINYFLAAKESQSNFKDTLRSFLQSSSIGGKINSPLYIVIDELDRCRPTYALEMLERIKHLFDVEGLVFILSTNTSQLSHSIRAVYGSEFASEDYLSRFFSRTYHLDDPDMEGFVRTLWRTLDVNESVFATETILPDPLDFVVALIQSCKFTLREAEHFMDLFSAATIMWEDEFPKMDFVYLCSIIAATMKGIKPDHNKEHNAFLQDHDLNLSGKEISSKHYVKANFRFFDYVSAMSWISRKPRNEWFAAYFYSEDKKVEKVRDIIKREYDALERMQYKKAYGFHKEYTRFVEQAGRLAN